MRVLTHREQNELVTPWITKRFDTVLPGLMTREGIDMWIIPTREYNEDPVFASMSPITYFASRRRTILVFYNPGGGKPVERYSIGRFDYDKLYTMYPTSNDGQHEGLRKLVEEKQPKVIGINESDAWNHADGITANEKKRLLDALGPTYAARVQVGRDAGGGLAGGEAARGARGLSPRHEGGAHGDPRGVLEQGDHARQDHERGRRVVDAPARRGARPRQLVPAVDHHQPQGRQSQPPRGPAVIQPGDMLHTDFGIVYMGFSTDTQHNAYVLLPGETDAPKGLKDGLKKANRLQELTMQFARLERTGNQALADAIAQAKKEDIIPSIYCHAIGYHGHAAGPPIGMTDYQEGVPVRGDYVFRPNTWHSIELNATHAVPEWDNQAVRFALEEDAALMPGGKWDWVDGRQTEFYLIKP